MRLSRDQRLLLATRTARMFAFGMATVVLIGHLEELGLSSRDAAALIFFALVGDLALTFPVTTRADRIGRRRVLMASALLMSLSGISLAASSDFFVLVLGCTIGVVTPSGNEIGPFQAVEQAALSQVPPPTATLVTRHGKRTSLTAPTNIYVAPTKEELEAYLSQLFAVYNFLGKFAQALGSVTCGLLVQNGVLRKSDVFTVYGACGALIALTYFFLTDEIEPSVEDRGLASDEAATTATTTTTTTTSKSIGIDVEHQIKNGEATTGIDAENQIESDEDDDDEMKPFNVPASSTSRDAKSVAAAEGEAVSAVRPLGAPQAQKRQDAPTVTLSRLTRFLGLKHDESASIVTKISALFVLDSFAGGLVMQSLVVNWFEKRYGLRADATGAVLAGANVFAALSSLVVGPLVRRFGAINVMVFTHIPANVLLIGVGLAGNLPVALSLYLSRFLFAQMDVPARQAFVASSVKDDERSAAGGIGNIVRSVGVACSPLGLLVIPPEALQFGAAFIAAGTLKIVYDLSVFWMFGSSSSAAA